MSMNRQDTLMESEKHNSSGIAERADLRTGPGKGKYDESKKKCKQDQVCDQGNESESSHAKRKLLDNIEYLTHTLSCLNVCLSMRTANPAAIYETGWTDVWGLVCKTKDRLLLIHGG